MKTCSNCGEVNSDTATFCIDCGRKLTPDTPVAASVKPVGIAADDLIKSIAEGSAAAALGKRKADVMFILDCTGSMRGEINAIRDAITSFADTIKTDGVRVRVGLVEFRDRLIGEEHRALSFAGQPFTDNPELFRKEVSALTAEGGGDDPESSLDAVMLALRQPFYPDASKVLVLVTDAPPHIPDRDTKSVEEVIQAIRTAGIQQFYLVMRTTDHDSQVYLKLLEAARGVSLAFDLGAGDDFRTRADNFKRTLMQLGKTISAATR